MRLLEYNANNWSLLSCCPCRADFIATILMSYMPHSERNVICHKCPDDVARGLWMIVSRQQGRHRYLQGRDASSAETPKLRIRLRNRDTATPGSWLITAQCTPDSPPASSGLSYGEPALPATDYSTARCPDAQPPPEACQRRLLRQLPAIYICRWWWCCNNHRPSPWRVAQLDTAQA